MHTFLTGASYPLRAFGVLRRHPVFWRYIIAPILLNMLVGVTLYAGLLVAGFRVIDGFIAGLPEWMALIAWLLRALLVIALLIATGFVLVRFGVVIGSPFYSRLSERLEERFSGVVFDAPSPTVGNVARDIARALLFEIKKALLALTIGAPALLLNLIPVVGSFLATASGIALGATISCLDFFDPPLERRRLRFRDKLGFVRQGLPATAGFGLVCLGLVSIPLINLFAVPLCITAGTLFYCEKNAAPDQTPHNRAHPEG
ncbi:EI24 domain-containing protein [Roseiflexus sp.]|uniref:EI24 domain-containing protein n=1 Tax=Roseiflexus sp. TaxID=2562120 RepID=UPI00398B493B